MVDILIRNGFVIDGSGKPGFTGDIAVKDGRIIAIAPKLTLEAARVVDAAGKTVIPGLIDPHVHEEYVCLIDGGMELFMRQGVTTCLSGNCGHAVFNIPMEKRRGLLLEQRLIQHRAKRKIQEAVPALG